MEEVLCLIGGFLGKMIDAARQRQRHVRVAVNPEPQEQLRKGCAKRVRQHVVDDSPNEHLVLKHALERVDGLVPVNAAT